MFFAIDESEESKKMILGGVLISKDKVPDFERDFVLLRIKHKLFGELKWQNIDQYFERYTDFLDLFFKYDASFHAICYRHSAKKYNASYILLRTITWKLQNAGLDNSLFVLFDNDGGLGNLGAKTIKEIAPKDIRFKRKLEFCNQGTSHILGILQIADIITGAVCAAVNDVSLSKEKQYIVDYITKKNDGLPLAWSSLKLPRLNQFKIHYFDPDNKP